MFHSKKNSWENSKVWKFWITRKNNIPCHRGQRPGGRGGSHYKYRIQFSFIYIIWSHDLPKFYQKTVKTTVRSYITRLTAIYLHNFTIILYKIQHGRGEQQTINRSKTTWLKMNSTEMRHNINMINFVLIHFSLL